MDTAVSGGLLAMVAIPGPITGRIDLPIPVQISGFSFRMFLPIRIFRDLIWDFSLIIHGRYPLYVQHKLVQSTTNRVPNLLEKTLNGH